MLTSALLVLDCILAAVILPQFLPLFRVEMADRATNPVSFVFEQVLFYSCTTAHGIFALVGSAYIMITPYDEWDFLQFLDTFCFVEITMLIFTCLTLGQSQIPCTRTHHALQ